jgi:hypothetical protein
MLKLNWRVLLFGCGMLALGYLLGVTGTVSVTVTAQDPASGPSDETADKVRAAHEALRVAMEALKSEGRYETITEGLNPFLILSGGGSAKQDLESGRGVDPETFAALYANQALPELVEQFERDEQGRVTYNGEVVRLYSRSRLERVFAERLKLNDVIGAN